MRPILATTLMTLAVLFSTASAWAEGSGDGSVGRCVDRPMPMVVESVSLASRWQPDADKAPGKVTDVLASVIRVDPDVVRPRGPRQNQSRAPVMCTDPSQPGCHVDRPNTPPHPTWSAVSAPSGDVSVGSLEIPPPGQTVFAWPCPVETVLASVHLRLPWRPPAA